MREKVDKEDENKATKKMLNSQKIILIILIIIFVSSGYIVLNWFYNTSKTEKKYEDLATSVVQTQEKDKNKEENKEQESEKINFDELNKINSDVVGWIKINNTTVDYPIMQTTDNEYYLKKDIYKKYDQCGSIFMDNKNKANFTDKNTVIYGHNIKKGIMFADLEKIYNGNLGNDIEINVYTKEKEMTYKVFSSYETEPEGYSINTNISENEMDNFIKTLSQRSKNKYDCEYEDIDQILTLSTCDNTGKKRILVHAVLTNISL